MDPNYGGDVGSCVSFSERFSSFIEQASEEIHAANRKLMDLQREEMTLFAMIPAAMEIIIGAISSVAVLSFSILSVALQRVANIEPAVSPLECMDKSLGYALASISSAFYCMTLGFFNLAEDQHWL